MSRLVLSTTVVFICLLLALDVVSAIPRAHHSRQNLDSSDDNSTALVPAGGRRPGSLSAILVPAAQSIVVAPLRLLRHLALELATFLGSHNMRELVSLQFLQKVVARLPERATTYWTTLVSMESQCAQRTVCDLAHYASRAMPQWVQQIALIYLNNFAPSHPYYRVAIEGLTSDKCPKLYDECDPEQFLARVRGNVTEAIEATVAPMREAFNELVNVTMSTLTANDDLARSARGSRRLQVPSN